MRRACAWLLLAAGLASLGGADPPRVEFLRPPRYLTDDTPITLTIRVRSHADNRLLVVAAMDELGDAVRRSDEQLDDTSRVTREIAWGTLGAGHYVLVAQVFNGEGQSLGRAESGLEVLAWRQ